MGEEHYKPWYVCTAKLKVAELRINNHYEKTQKKV